MQFRSDHMLPASAHLRPGTIALLSVVLLAVASIPIATHQLPPLSDYINHLARTHVIDAIGTDPDLGRYYVVEWQIIPNLMIDLIVPVLHRFMSVYLAGQIFTIAAFALIASGTLVFSRALNGRWSPLPLVALPLLYNGVLLVGVMNYVFGIGLALWALGLGHVAGTRLALAVRSVSHLRICAVLLPFVCGWRVRRRLGGARTASPVAAAK
jgi:hypothetical protein